MGHVDGLAEHDADLMERAADLLKRVVDLEDRQMDPFGWSGNSTRNWIGHWVSRELQLVHDLPRRTEQGLNHPLPLLLAGLVDQDPK